MKSKIGIIGCGNMGGAIITGIGKKFTVLACETDRRRAQSVKRKYGVRLVDRTVIFSECATVILAIKPQGFPNLLNNIRALIRKEHLLISIAAGISTSFIEKSIGNKVRVVRAMPNLPSQIGLGITAIARGQNATVKDLRLAEDLFKLIGKVDVLAEGLIDAVTAVSGSGPAYLFYFIECLESAARSIGLSSRQGKKFVMATLDGSLELLKSGSQDAAVLRKQVTSKGGTTQAALDVFEKNKMNKIIKDAMLAAKKRSKELSK